jgi:hypothetical protein
VSVASGIAGAQDVGMASPEASRIDGRTDGVVEVDGGVEGEVVSPGPNVDGGGTVEGSVDGWDVQAAAASRVAKSRPVRRFMCPLLGPAGGRILP